MRAVVRCEQQGAAVLLTHGDITAGTELAKMLTEVCPLCFIRLACLQLHGVDPLRKTLPQLHAVS